MPRVSSVEFYCATTKEHQDTHRRGIDPQYEDYVCGGCARPTKGRVIARAIRDGGTTVKCAVCECGEPTCFTISVAGQITKQSPMGVEFSADDKWPKDIVKLYQEAALCFAAGAYTTSAMVCRKILMACACQEGDTDGKSFVSYVDYITNTVLTFPKAKAAIDKIRNIGNDANHNVAFVNPADARTAMRVIQYMLEAIYSFPAA